MVSLLLLMCGLSFGMLFSSPILIQDAEDFYNPKGILQTTSNEDAYVFEWNSTLGGIYIDGARGIAVDSNDDVYVAGYQDISGSNTNRDIVIAKYNPIGEQQWIRYWGGSNDDIAYNLLIDAFNNIYIVGFTKSFDDINGDAVIIKYDINGQQQWNFTWGGSEFDFATALDIDSNNNMYLGFTSKSFGDIDGDIVLVKFNSTWHEQWNVTWGGSDSEEIADLYIDTNDDIYISGRSDSLDPSPGEGDAFLNKYNSTGDLQWSRNWGGSYSQMASGIATDSLNNVYITGMTFGHPSSSEKGVIVKYNSEGTYQWEEIWGVNGVYANYMYRIIIDSNDDLYVSGTTRSYGIPNNNDAILFNYDTDGNQIWYNVWSEYEWDLSFGLCMDSQSNIYLVGDTKSYTIGQNDILLLKYAFVSNIPSIEIITPENKTYTEPDIGYYPATFGFENDEDDTIPNGWEYRLTIPQGDSYIKIIPSLDGHEKVLDLNKGNTYGSHLLAGHNFSDQEFGTIEFWLRTTDVTEATEFILRNRNNDASFCAIGVGGQGLGPNFTIYTSGGWQSLPYPANNNKWYHIRFQFECGTGNHYGLDQFFFRLYIDGLEIGDFSFSSNQPKVDQITILQNWLYDNYHSYFDAISFSWDPNYNIGDNLNEGLLLSYSNNTNFDWIGYSLDGSSNITITGNKVIPFPEIGQHSIILNGITSIGMLTKSDLRYFTIGIQNPPIPPDAPSPFPIIPIILTSIGIGVILMLSITIFVFRRRIFSRTSSTIISHRKSQLEENVYTGSDQFKVCPFCGTQVKKTNQFCRYCGASLKND